MPEDPTPSMQCMEVLGGSQLTERGVHMGGLDAWVYSKPYGQARHGGDVYFASSCATGRISRLLLADVCGHGKAVADTATDLRRLMRQYVNYLDQTAFVRSMNQRFTTMSADGCFATAVVTTFFAPTNSLSVCNAGHPPPLLYQAAQRKWRLLEAEVAVATEVDDTFAPSSNMPLGIIELVEYEQFEVQMAADDLLVCYTDALSEARDTAGQLIGEQGLLELVRSMPAVEPHRFIEAVLAALVALNPENLSTDDVTVMVLRPNGEAPSMSFPARMRAGMRLAAGVFRSFGPGGGRVPLPDFTIANLGGAIVPVLSRWWRPKVVPLVKGVRRGFRRGRSCAIDPRTP